MKQGMSIEELAKEITRQSKSKRDFKAPTSLLSMVVDETQVKLEMLDKRGDLPQTFATSELFHDQLGNHLKIPAAYYDKMRTEAPELLAANVNHWFHERPAETRLVRTLDGTARAFLSNRYRMIDNFDIASATLPIFLDEGKKLGLRIESANVSDRALHIKAVSERIKGDVLGQQVQSGIVISNSEVGLHLFRVEPMVWVLSCENGAIMPDAGMRRYHIGRQSAELDTAIEVFADETRRADDKALMLKVRDVVKASFDELAFRNTLKHLKLTAANKLERGLKETVESVVEVFSLPDKYQDGLLERLAKEDHTQWGLSNAITAFAQDKSLAYDEATDLERIGGEILTLAPSKWKEIAQAA